MQKDVHYSRKLYVFLCSGGHYFDEAGAFKVTHIANYFVFKFRFLKYDHIQLFISFKNTINNIYYIHTHNTVLNN